jgi:hypothetical protein
MTKLKRNYIVQVEEWKKMGYDKDLWIFIYHLNPNSPYFHQTMIIRLQLFLFEIQPLNP